MTSYTGYRARDFIYPVIIGIVFTAISVLMWYLLFISEQRAFAQDFSNRANNQATFLQERIGDYWS
jgi:CHASE1-domain containing sensor protein